LLEPSERSTALILRISIVSSNRSITTNITLEDFMHSAIGERLREL